LGHLHSYKGLEHIFELAGHLKTANIELHSFGGNEAQVLSLQEIATIYQQLMPVIQEAVNRIGGCAQSAYLIFLKACVSQY
jgi:hypothetical protein